MEMPVYHTSSNIWCKLQPADGLILSLDSKLIRLKNGYVRATMANDFKAMLTKFFMKKVQEGSNEKCRETFQIYWSV